MRLGIAQINPTVGDLRANADMIVREALVAARDGADLVAFPELAIVGYPPLDLLDEPEFVRRALDATAALVERLGSETGDLPVVFGSIREAPADAGKSLQNVAILARGGREIAVRPKSLLPSYDVFDEDRWFRPAHDAAPVAGPGGSSIGLTVCEDIWNDAAFWERRIYDRDPVAELATRGASLILNISASPYHRGKSSPREAMLRAAAQRHGIPVAYVNQVGANDELIFDGGSLVIDAAGDVLARAPLFEPATIVVDLAASEAGAAIPHPGPVSGSACELRRALVLGLADYVRKCGFPGVLVGLSGGIDSAVVACLAAEALGPARVHVVLMPSRFTSPRSNDDAMELSRRLGVAARVVPIEPAHAALLGSLAPHFEGRPSDVTEENLQARIRGTILMALSNKLGHLVLATGNKSEMGVGYCTLYGDMVGGIAVLGDCYKAWVRELAADFNRSPAPGSKAAREIIPAGIIDRPPSAELRPDQEDEHDLPAYAVLDRILEGLVERRRSCAELEAEGFAGSVVRRVRALLDRSEFKRRQAAPILRVTPRAFGPGRRLPIARG